MLELLQNIAGLDRAAELLEEVIIVNNCSTENYSAVKDYITGTPGLPFRYFDAPANLGVAKGRNFALGKGVAPLVIMLDDDAVLQNSDCLVNLLEEFQDADTIRRKAIISFRVLYFDTLEMQKNALPHKDYAHYHSKHNFETYYYAGGAHAIRREVFDKVGHYPETFFYGMEEYDLSYRILDAGYNIVYSDRITMLHKESPLGRKPKEEKYRMMWVNKSKVAYKYLPIIYFISTVLLWSIFYFRSTGFNLRGLFKGYRDVFRIPRTEKRQKISAATINYLRRVNARLWY